jgi:hypothetical protein
MQEKKKKKKKEEWVKGQGERMLTGYERNGAWSSLPGGETRRIVIEEG